MPLNKSYYSALLKFFYLAIIFIIRGIIRFKVIIIYFYLRLTTGVYTL